MVALFSYMERHNWDEGKTMRVIFYSNDFVSIEGAGLGFVNRRPMASSWHYQGKVQHRDWQGTYECYWNSTHDKKKTHPTELVWIVRGDNRLFGLAAALKARGISTDVEQDTESVQEYHD